MQRVHCSTLWKPRAHRWIAGLLYWMLCCDTCGLSAGYSVVDQGSSILAFNTPRRHEGDCMLHDACCVLHSELRQPTALSLYDSENSFSLHEILPWRDIRALYHPMRSKFARYIALSANVRPRHPRILTRYA